MPMASMVVMMTPRPEVELDARSVAVVVVPVSWAMPVAAMPVAPVAHLLDAGAVAACDLEVSDSAYRRSLRWRRQKAQRNSGHGENERTTVSHSFDLLLDPAVRKACPPAAVARPPLLPRHG
jgi:hypothetical protein